MEYKPEQPTNRYAIEQNAILENRTNAAQQNENQGNVVRNNIAELPEIDYVTPVETRGYSPIRPNLESPKKFDGDTDIKGETPSPYSVKGSNVIGDRNMVLNTDELPEIGDVIPTTNELSGMSTKTELKIQKPNKRPEKAEPKSPESEKQEKPELASPKNQQELESPRDLLKKDGYTPKDPDMILRERVDMLKSTLYVIENHPTIARFVDTTAFYLTGYDLGAKKTAQDNPATFVALHLATSATLGAMQGKLGADFSAILLNAVIYAIREMGEISGIEKCLVNITSGIFSNAVLFGVNPISLVLAGTLGIAKCAVEVFQLGEVAQASLSLVGSIGMIHQSNFDNIITAVESLKASYTIYDAASHIYNLAPHIYDFASYETANMSSGGDL